jgi:hypothetical protein
MRRAALVHAVVRATILGGMSGAAVAVLLSIVLPVSVLLPDLCTDASSVRFIADSVQREASCR